MTVPPAPIRVYRHALSGHAHRVELLLSLLGLPFERVDVDLLAGAHKRPDFLAKNAWGKVPVLEDGEVVLADSNAIMVYLVKRYAPQSPWLPDDALGAAQVQKWFSVAAGELVAGPGELRRAALFQRPIDETQPRAVSARLFDVLEAQLTSHDFLVGSTATLADLALYSYVARAPEGGLSLAPYPALQRWLARIEALPGFIPMAHAPTASSSRV